MCFFAILNQQCLQEKEIAEEIFAESNFVIQSHKCKFCGIKNFEN